VDCLIAPMMTNLLFYALLSQLVEEAVLEAVQSEFESQRGHQVLLPFVQWIGHDSSKVIMGVRFPHGGPVNASVVEWYTQQT
jgi:hypothetical protein